MVEVKTSETVETKTTEDPVKDWAKFIPRPVIVAKLMASGGVVDGVTIQPMHMALLTDGGLVASMDAVLFEALFAPA